MQLAAFALKRLGEDDRAKVEKHLAECNTCRAFLAKTPGDDLARLLREHQATSLHQQSTPAMHDQSTMSGRRRQASNPQQSQLSAGGSPVKGAANAAETIPPELRQQKKYRVLRLLGRGGMGAVYEADHTMMRRKVAIKVISPSLISDPQALQRFELEVVAAAQLDHPNVARAYDADQFGSMRALIMEFVPGRSLDKLLASVGSLPIETACRCVRQALAGLQHAHEHGMVHRDLKPHNLMLTPEGKLKVLDFGLAKLTESQAVGEGLTSANAIMGTTHYMAPEQALDAKTADIRADIYSLGCTLFYLIAGRPPFEADTEMKILLAHQRDVPPPVNELRDDVPEGLAKLIAWMLEKNPADRPQTPVEIGRALAPYARGEFDTAGPEADTTQKEATELEAIAKLAEVSALPKTRIEKPQPSGNRRNYWISAGAGILASSFFFAWLFGGFKANTPEGSIIIDHVPADVSVEVDGATVTLTRDDETVTITAVEVGEHHLRFLRDGQEVWASDATLLIGRDSVRVTYEPVIADPPVAEENSSPGDGEPSDEQMAHKNGEPSEANYQERFPLATVFKGDWSTEGNIMTQSTISDEDSIVSFGNLEWENYDIRLQARVDKGPGGFLVCFNLVDRANFRLFAAGAHENQHHTITACFRGSWDTYGHYSKGKAASLKRGKWYDVRIEVRGASCKCFLDSHLWFEGQDERLTKGEIGLGTNRSASSFRDILVTSADGRVELWKGFPDLPAMTRSSPSEDAGSDVTISAESEIRFARLYGGDWQIEEGELVQLSDGAEIKSIAFGDMKWRDLDISAEVKIPDTAGPKVFVVFNTTEVMKCRALRLGCQYQELYRLDGKLNEDPVRQVHNGLSPGWHKIEITLRDGKCECFLDGKRLFEPHQDSAYAAGCIGFATYGTSGRFRNIEVTAPDGETLWTGLPYLRGKTGDSAGEPSNDPSAIAVPAEKNGLQIDENLWSITDPEWVKTGVEGTAISSGEDGNYVTSKRTDYGDVTLDLNISAKGGTEAWVIVRGKEVNGAWDGVIIPIKDARGMIEIGAQKYAADVVERGEKVKTIAYSKPFDLRVHSAGIAVRTEVNGELTSYVPYPDRGLASSGAIGIYVKRGEVTIHQLAVKEDDNAPPVEAKQTSTTPSASPTAVTTDDEDFIPLFNGRDLSGWKTHPASDRGWRVENGLLIGEDRNLPRGNYLFTERDDFTDVHIRAEVRINQAGNSGLIARASYAPGTSGYEAAITQNPRDLVTTGGIYANGEGVVLRAQSAVGDDEWFTLEEIVKGNEITVIVNGTETAKWIDESQKSARGHIAVQLLNKDTIVQFRSIEVKELTSGEKQSDIEDKILTELSEAKKQFEAVVAEETQSLLEMLERKRANEKVPSRKEQIEAEIKALKEEGTLPTSASAGQYRRKVMAAKRLLDAAYRQAIENYRSEKREADALEIQREWYGAPKDAIEFNGHFYKFFPEELTWYDARNRCVEAGGHLVSVTTALENSVVTYLVKSARWETTWLGGSDEGSEGRWYWVDKEVSSYTNWDTLGNQPNNKRNEEHFMVLWVRKGHEGVWCDQPFKSTEHRPGFVCEWDGEVAP